MMIPNAIAFADLTKRVEALEERVREVEGRISGFHERVATDPSISARQVILLWLETHRAFSASYVAWELDGTGVTSHALQVAVARMCRSGLLRRIGTGIYQAA